MSVRVLWLIKGLGPGGAEVLLATAAESGFGADILLECAYVLPQKDHLVERLERAGVRCHCLAADGSTWRWPLRLRQLLALESYDVIHAHSPLPAAVGRLVSKTIRDSPALMSTEHNAWGTFALSTRWANRISMGLDDAVFAVSDETRASMSRQLRARCSVLVHGIDLKSVASLRSERGDVRRELGVDDSTFVVGTVANYREQKDYPNLLRAAAAWRGGADVCVVAVGQGPLEQEILELRDRLGLTAVVKLLGYRPDATRVMAACDAFTLSSSWEGLPVALMEALALSLPIAATRVGGVDETLGDDDALLVPPGDSRALAAAWECLRTDDELRSRLARRSAERSVDFDAGRSTAMYETTYRSLARDRSLAPEPERVATTPPVSDPANQRQRHRPLGIDIRPANEGDRSRILDLLTRTLGWGDDPRYAELFRWKHDDNSFGPSPMWVAADGDRIVGLRVFMRWNFVRGEDTLRAMRAVDTAVDPEYQGKGLFTALTLAGLEELQAEGIDFVFNTPNDQSLPGYLKMGWQEVGRVPAAFRLRHPATTARTLRARVPADLWSSPLELGVPADNWLATHEPDGARPATGSRALSTPQTSDFLRWRYANALLGYRVWESHGATLMMRSRQRGPAQELVLAGELGATNRQSRAAAIRSAVASTTCDHVLLAGGSDARHGLLPLPNGPLLTFRALNLSVMPPLDNWALTLGDIELF